MHRLHGCPALAPCPCLTGCNSEQNSSSTVHNKSKVTTDVTLNHRGDVAALIVFHKAHIQHVLNLRGPTLIARNSQRSAREALTSECSVAVPQSNSSQYQRIFISRTARLWNVFTTSSQLKLKFADSTQ